MEKEKIDLTYNHICKLGLEKEFKNDPKFFLSLVWLYSRDDLFATITDLSKNDLEVMLYARKQFNEGKISEPEMHAVYERTDHGTPYEVFDYIDTPESEIPESVYCESYDTKYSKKAIIEDAKINRDLRKILDRQFTPCEITVVRMDDYETVFKNIKIGDKSITELMDDPNNIELILNTLNNPSKPVGVKYNNFIGTSIGFNNVNGNIKWDITVPKGSKGAYLDGFGAGGGELEFLLQAGTTLQIEKAEYKKGVFYIKAKAVQTKPTENTAAEPETTNIKTEVSEKPADKEIEVPDTKPTDKALKRSGLLEFLFGSTPTNEEITANMSRRQFKKVMLSRKDANGKQKYSEEILNESGIIDVYMQNKEIVAEILSWKDKNGNEIIDLIEYKGGPNVYDYVAATCLKEIVQAYNNNPETTKFLLSLKNADGSSRFSFKCKLTELVKAYDEDPQTIKYLFDLKDKDGNYKYDGKKYNVSDEHVELCLKYKDLAIEFFKNNAKISIDPKELLNYLDGMVLNFYHANYNNLLYFSTYSKLRNKQLRANIC